MPKFRQQLANWRPTMHFGHKQQFQSAKNRPSGVRKGRQKEIFRRKICTYKINFIHRGRNSLVKCKLLTTYKIFNAIKAFFEHENPPHIFANNFWFVFFIPLSLPQLYYQWEFCFYASILSNYFLSAQTNKQHMRIN